MKIILAGGGFAYIKLESIDAMKQNENGEICLFVKGIEFEAQFSNELWDKIKEVLK